MNDITKDHIVELLKKDKRLDGRGLLDFRPVSIEKGAVSTAEGSAEVNIGDTKILVGVKLGIEKPYPDSPDEGGLMVNVELLPMSNPEFESGPPGIDAIEIARVVDRGIREAKAIDVKKLGIEEGEKAWFVMIDACTLNASGNLIDAAAIGAIAALKDARFPAYDGVSIDYRGEKTEEGLPLVKVPIPVTVCKIADKFIVDPSEEEEKAIDARLTVASLANGKVCAMQKGGKVPLTAEEVEQMVKIGVDKAGELRKLVEE